MDKKTIMSKNKLYVFKVIQKNNWSMGVSKKLILLGWKYIY